MVLRSISLVCIVCTGSQATAQDYDDCKQMAARHSVQWKDAYELASGKKGWVGQLSDMSRRHTEAWANCMTAARSAEDESRAELREASSYVDRFVRKLGTRAGLSHTPLAKAFFDAGMKQLEAQHKSVMSKLEETLTRIRDVSPKSHQGSRFRPPSLSASSLQAIATSLKHESSRARGERLRIAARWQADINAQVERARESERLRKQAQLQVRQEREREARERRDRDEQRTGSSGSKSTVGIALDRMMQLLLGATGAPSGSSTSGRSERARSVPAGTRCPPGWFLAARDRDGAACIRTREKLPSDRW